VIRTGPAQLTDHQRDLQWTSAVRARPV
jgi:hypothetical protein